MIVASLLITYARTRTTGALRVILSVISFFAVYSDPRLYDGIDVIGGERDDYAERTSREKKRLSLSLAIRYWIWP